MGGGASTTGWWASASPDVALHCFACDAPSPIAHILALLVMPLPRFTKTLSERSRLFQFLFADFNFQGLPRPLQAKESRASKMFGSEKPAAEDRAETTRDEP